MAAMALRPPTVKERTLLGKLAMANFPGSKEVIDQLQSFQVKEIDENGSLELVSASGLDARVIGRVPVEGELVDRDGVRVHILLHVVNGRIKELEVFKEDGSKVL